MNAFSLSKFEGMLSGDGKLLRKFRRLKRRLPPGASDLVSDWYVDVDLEHDTLRYAIPYVPVANKKRAIQAWSDKPTGPVMGTPYWTNGAIMAMTRQFASVHDIAVLMAPESMSRFILDAPATKMTMFYDLELSVNPVVEVSNDDLACFVDCRYLDVAHDLFGPTTAYLNKNGTAVILREHNLSLMLIMQMTVEGGRPLQVLNRLRGGLNGKICRT